MKHLLTLVALLFAVNVQAAEWSWNLEATSNHNEVGTSTGSGYLFGFAVATHGNGDDGKGRYTNGGIVADFSPDWFIVNSPDSVCAMSSNWSPSYLKPYAVHSFKNTPDGICAAHFGYDSDDYIGPLTGQQFIRFSPGVRQFSFWVAAADSDRYYPCAGGGLCSGQTYCGPYAGARLVFCEYRLHTSSEICVDWTSIGNTAGGDAFYEGSCSGNVYGALCRWQHVEISVPCDKPAATFVDFNVANSLVLFDKLWASDQDPLVCEGGQCNPGCGDRARQARDESPKAPLTTLQRTAWLENGIAHFSDVSSPSHATPATRTSWGKVKSIYR